MSAVAIPMRCPDCRTDQRASYDVVFHGHGVERRCGHCGCSIEVERTDPLRLDGEPDDCLACAAGHTCAVDKALLQLRLDDVRRVLAHRSHAA